MAGSYNHVVVAPWEAVEGTRRPEDVGKLVDGDTINGMLECMSGDVVECVEEMYGMIWYLAHSLVGELEGRDPYDRAEVMEFIEVARQNYEQGLKIGLDGGKPVTRGQRR